MGPNSVDCPSCRYAGGLRLRERAFSLRHSIAWTYECPCGVEVTFEATDRELVGGPPLNVATALAELARTGQVSRGKLSIHHPTPGSSWVGLGFASGGLVPPGGAGSGWTLDPEPGPALRALDGSVIGYRAWKLHNWTLAGTGVHVSWEPGVNEAKCSVSSHRAPADGCLRHVRLSPVRRPDLVVA